MKLDECIVHIKHQIVCASSRVLTDSLDNTTQGTPTFKHGITVCSGLILFNAVAKFACIIDDYGYLELT